MKLCLALFLGLLAGGCSSAGTAPLESGKPTWMYYSAEKRGAIADSREKADRPMLRSLSEPPPDVAISRTMDFLAKVGYQNLTVDAKASIAESMTTLAHRTERVELLRDACFRLAEGAFNLQTTPTEYTTALSGIVAKLADLARTDVYADGIKAIQAVRQAELAANAESKKLITSLIEKNAVTDEKSRNQMLTLLLEAEAGKGGASGELAKSLAAYQATAR